MFLYGKASKALMTSFIDGLVVRVNVFNSLLHLIKSIDTNYLINETSQKYVFVKTVMGLKGNMTSKGNPICYELSINILKSVINLLF